MTDIRAAAHAPRWTALAIAVGLAYLVLGVAALIYASDKLHAPDEFEYLAIGKNITERGLFSMDGITPTAWRSPGLPALIAALWWIWPSTYLIKLVNIACWSATGFLVGRLSAFFYGVSVGSFVALLYLCYILELYAATTLYPQTVAGFLVIAAVSLVVMGGRISLVRQLALAMTGLFQILVIPNCILATIAVYFYAVLKGKLRIEQALLAGLLILSIVLAWCYRNERAIGGFSFTTSMGITLYDGNRSNVTAAGAGSNDTLDDASQTRGLSEVEIDELYRKYAIDWIRFHPWQFTKLAVAKFFYWFTYENHYETQRSVPLVGLLSLWAALIYYLILSASLLAVSSSRKAVRDFAILAWCIYLGSLATYVVFLTRIRYRLPFDPLLFVVGAGTIFSWLGGIEPSAVGWARMPWNLVRPRRGGGRLKRTAEDRARLA